jgi:hypothetical protein
MKKGETARRKSGENEGSWSVKRKKNNAVYDGKGAVH